MPSKKIVLRFPKSIADKPLIYKLIKDFNLVFNILKGKITPDEEGVLVLELIGKEEDFKKGTKFLEDNGCKVEPLSKEIERDEKLCTHCTTCITHCPTGALYIKDRKTMEVAFDKSKCILCEACISICPVNAMKTNY